MNATPEQLSLEQCREIKPDVVNLRIPLVSDGHHKILLAETEHLTMRVHCYAPGIGENDMHAHIDEEHIFVVLDGEAQFSTLDGPLAITKKNQAIVLPKGCFYGFSNPSKDTPLVLLRIGAGADAILSGKRISPNGEPVPGRAQKTGATKPQIIEGGFFE
ncbi:MAG: cupin domain-containing protein [Alphaproteobacteria bacterium]|jgi:mannose-6-phosphate isomerase-like protein (cupin superfamily)